MFVLNIPAVCEAPVDTCVHDDLPTCQGVYTCIAVRYDTAAGADLSAAVLSPTAPLAPAPHPKRPPVISAPTELLLMSLVFTKVQLLEPICAGTDLLAVAPVPNAPDVPAPHAHNIPVLEIPRLLAVPALITLQLFPGTCIALLVLLAREPSPN